MTDAISPKSESAAFGAIDAARRHAPATVRNRDPILTVLQEVLPTTGEVLEIASGSGEHAVHFARALPRLTWRPSDPSPDARASIAAWTRAEALDNLAPPLDLDAASPDWPIDRTDAVVCINMIHISPWEACEGLMRGAGGLLPVGAPLVLYGPFRRGDRPLEPSDAATAPSNRATRRSTAISGGATRAGAYAISTRSPPVRQRKASRSSMSSTCQPTTCRSCCASTRRDSRLTGAGHADYPPRPRYSPAGFDLTGERRRRTVASRPEMDAHGV